MKALSRAAGSSDFVLVPGTVLAHRFEERAAVALGTVPDAQAVRELTTNTMRYVAGSLQAALPGRPIILALGNNDSDCGDYRMSRRGHFSLQPAIQCVSWGARNPSARSSIRHTLQADITACVIQRFKRRLILVVNDMFWSANIATAAVDNGLAAATAMMSSLEPN